MTCLDKIWSAIAMDHAHNPRHYGPLACFNGYACITGPCGDTMAIWLYIEGDRIVEASFLTDGCGGSLASGSMTTSLAIGKSLPDAEQIDQPMVLAALDGLPEDEKHCALLAANTLQAARRYYESNHFSTGSPAPEILHNDLK